MSLHCFGAFQWHESDVAGVFSSSGNVRSGFDGYPSNSGEAIEASA